MGGERSSLPPKGVFMLVRVLAITALAATLASAQRGGGGGRGGGMGGDMGAVGMGMPMPRQTKADQVADKLKLSKEQKEELGQILSAGAEQAAPLRGQLGNARVQLAGVLIEGKGEADLKKAQDAVADVSAQIASVETKAFAKIYAMLKPNQQPKAPQAFELMAGMFSQGGGRGPGGGMGRRGGRQ
jgi:Spy/CpxP family protein refolding chaperone